MSPGDDVTQPPLSRHLHWWFLAGLLVLLLVATYGSTWFTSRIRMKHTHQHHDFQSLPRPSVRSLLRRLASTVRSKHQLVDEDAPSAKSHLIRLPREPRMTRPRPRVQDDRRGASAEGSLPTVRAQARSAPILAFTSQQPTRILPSAWAPLRRSGNTGFLPPLSPPRPVRLSSVDKLFAPALGPSRNGHPDRRARNQAVVRVLGPAHHHDHVLLPGTIIPAVLLTRLVSDLPGLVEARTSRAIYGSINERTLLVPPGSLLIGRYQNDVRAGARRIFVSFGRIELPGGGMIRLPGMEAAGSRGAAGLHDLVRTHFWRMFGSSFLIAGLGAALPTRTDRVLLLPAGTPLVLGTAAGDALDQTVQSLLSRDQNLPPTIIIRRGTRFNVLVAHTIVFPESVVNDLRQWSRSSQ